MSYSEQSEVLRFEQEFCNYAYPFLVDLGAVLRGPPWTQRQGTDIALPHWWRLRDGNKHSKRTHVVFRSLGYINGDRQYDPPTVYEEPSEDAGQRERIVAPPEGLQRKISREVKDRRESSSDYRGAVSFTISHTDKASAKAKGGIEGVADVEASVESTTQETLKTDFGWANGQKAAHEVTIRGETTINIPGNQTRILTASMSRVKEVRAFRDIAYMDCEIDLDLYDWVGNYCQRAAWRGEHDNVIHCANIQDLIWLMEGGRPVEYPGMNNFLENCSEGSRDFHAWLSNRENRRVEIEGQRVDTYPGALNLEVRAE